MLCVGLENTNVFRRSFDQLSVSPSLPQPDLEYFRQLIDMIFNKNYSVCSEKRQVSMFLKHSEIIYDLLINYPMN